ncbi:MAG TPA: ATP-binding protein [Casimicrobiaceae bacterium]|nr:ATP-binding protein [Casimicrobiaceae bacterium]
MADRPRSIRRQLLVVLLVSVAAIWNATGIVSYFDARHEVDELLDSHLAQLASLVIAEVQSEPDETDFQELPALHRYAHRLAFQVWEHGNAPRLRTANAPEARLSPNDDGFSDVTIDGQRWRVFSEWDDRHWYLVQVGEHAGARDEVAARIAENMLLPLAVALPILGTLIWFGISRALNPLRTLSRQVEHRAPDNLAPLESGGAPAEVAPLALNLNRLFARVRASMENERRFTADAAHELRTPLAALRAQAQVARGATSDGERERALDNVIVGCDRATHLVEQLLTLARLEPDGFEARREACDLRAVAKRAIADAAPAALARTIDIELAEGPPVQVAADGRLLGILLRNLLDNAVRYSYAHTVVRVDTGERQGSAYIVVADQGPGVAPEDRARLGQRFHRLVGGGISGSGLGLSIVERIAEIHGATVSFDEAASGKGLAVTVSFPAAVDAAQPPS